MNRSAQHLLTAIAATLPSAAPASAEPTAPGPRIELSEHGELLFSYGGTGSALELEHEVEKGSEVLYPDPDRVGDHGAARGVG